MALVDFSAPTGEFNADPYPTYSELRAAGPVHRIKGADGRPLWLVVGYEEARQALGHPLLCKNPSVYGDFDKALLGATSTNMLESDPPHHTRLRKLVSREFTPRRVEALRPRVQEVTDRLLDAMEAGPGRSCDLIPALALPVPMTVICELLGVPGLDRDRFHDWSSQIVSAPIGSLEQLGPVLEAMTTYLIGLLADKTEEPGDDLLSALIRTRDEDGDSLSSDELVGMAYLLLVAGHETTVNLISNGVRALLAHPEQLADLRADFDGLLDGAIEEMLRYDGPVENATIRFAAEDLVLGGVAIEAGASVVVSLASGDRDGERFPRPDTFDIRRATQGHLAFGHGIHFCLGAPLARMEARIAIRSLLERFPDLAAEPAAGPPQWIEGTLIRGVAQLPVRW
ncbi:cytochrome P450 [Streptomyces sp. ISL-66]|uniref:cytochrome P450 family protein n=1 Tax=Streptomyces sp. ISL-66 TaxID=2819186 RepID=UPI001BEB2459|nr:cytochrome P450 [Streptomyces sp. ISL-66]MBT2468824.1 cytochrome P450 [Streptomyces sp. ISL-66]